MLVCDLFPYSSIRFFLVLLVAVCFCCFVVFCCLCVFELLIVMFVSCAFFRFIVYFREGIPVLRLCLLLGVFLFCVCVLFVFVAPFPCPFIVVVNALCMSVCCLLFVLCPPCLLIIFFFFFFSDLIIARLRYYCFPFCRSLCSLLVPIILLLPLLLVRVLFVVLSFLFVCFVRCCVLFVVWCFVGFAFCGYSAIVGFCVCFVFVCSPCSNHVLFVFLLRMTRFFVLLCCLFCVAFCLLKCFLILLFGFNGVARCCLYVFCCFVVLVAACVFRASYCRVRFVCLSRYIVYFGA